MTPTILVNCTHGREEPERATLSFVVGNVSATADQPTAVLLTIDGVWLATTGTPTPSSSLACRRCARCWRPSSTPVARSGPAARVPGRAASPRTT